MAAQMLSPQAQKFLRNYAISMAKANGVFTAQQFFYHQPTT